MPSSVPASVDPRTLARTAGLRQIHVPRLEEVDRRRAQLWGLSLLVAVGVPAIMVAVGINGLPDILRQTFDLRTARLAMLAMLVVVMGYVAEREITLRRLTALLVEERVMTASLVNRVEELNLLLHATRAMNAALDLPHVLTEISRSAAALLRAESVVLYLLDGSAPDHLEVAAVHGPAGVDVGAAEPLDAGLAGRAMRERDALLSTEDHRGARRAGVTGGVIAVPMEVRGQLVGVLQVAAGAPRDAFTEFDLRGVSVFANAAAAAIANARSYEDQLGRVASLLDADQAKDEFLTLVTHELRTPLTSMIGLLSTMSTRSTSLTPDQITEFAGIAQTQGWRLDRLIGDLLDSSRSQRRALEIHPEITPVDRVVRSAVRAVDQSTPDRDVRCEVPEGLVRVLDSDVLLRIVDNLLSNALKYTPADSPIVVRVSEEARGLRIDVIDHGDGIDPASRTALFDKFTRGADPYERGGLGLGLYVVEALAEAHAGRVEVTETPGGGATFSVWLAAWSSTEPVDSPAPVD